jgi:hypothetical protein
MRARHVLKWLIDIGHAARTAVGAEKIDERFIITAYARAGLKIILPQALLAAQLSLHYGRKEEAHCCAISKVEMIAHT